MSLLASPGLCGRPMGVYLLLYFIKRLHADDAQKGLAFPEHHDRWYASDIISYGNKLFFVHIYLYREETSRVFLCDLHNNRAYHLARNAPCCPEIDKHGLVRRGDQLVKRTRKIRHETSQGNQNHQIKCSKFVPYHSPAERYIIKEGII